MPVDETARGIDDSLSFSLPYQPILPSEYVRDDDTSRQRIPSVHRRENRRSKHAPNRTGPIYRPTWNLRKKKKKKGERIGFTFERIFLDSSISKHSAFPSKDYFRRFSLPRVLYYRPKGVSVPPL